MVCSTEGGGLTSLFGIGTESVDGVGGVVSACLIVVKVCFYRA